MDVGVAVTVVVGGGVTVLVGVPVLVPVGIGVAVFIAGGEGVCVAVSVSGDAQAARMRLNRIARFKALRFFIQPLG
jgi:hypothetical protein